MAGRYTGWHHKKSSGQVSSGDLAAARKVLGILENRLKLGNVKSGGQRVVLDNGTVIDANIAMGTPTVRITPARGAQVRIPANELGEIITTPRSAAAPDGVDEDHPEVMLRHGPDDFWRTYFYSTPEGYTGESGSYANMFPKGLGQGGNCDWIGPDGERLSWYGPSSRAFADAYVHGPRQHGKQVYYLGEVLLDVDEYADDAGLGAGHTARYIAGAALREIEGTWWLYTVQYASALGETPPPYVAPPDIIQTSYFTYPLAATTELDGGVYRYRLFPYTDPHGVVRFKVASESREWLVGTVTGSPDAWFFNRECTEAICHPALTNTGPPGKPWWAARVETRDFPPDEFDVIPPEQQPHPPAPRGLRFRVLFDDAGEPISATTTEMGVVSGGAGATVTADYDATTDALVEYYFRFGADLVPYFMFDSTEAATYQSSIVLGGGTAGGHIITGLTRALVYVNPRDHIVVLMRQNVVYDTGIEDPDSLISHTQTMELYIDGVLVEEQEIATGADAKFGLVKRFGDATDFLHNLTGVQITPQWFVFGLLLTISDVDYGPSEPPSETSWGTQGHYIGANAMFYQFPYPTECWFGISDAIIPPSGTSQTVAEKVTAGFNGNVPDDNGYFSVAGAARHAEAVVVSCWTPKAGMDTSFTHTTGSVDLQELTTIGGAEARYHPLRILGKMPVEERVEEVES